jgi:hypothetical protein
MVIEITVASQRPTRLRPTQSSGSCGNRVRERGNQTRDGNGNELGSASSTLRAQIAIVDLSRCALSA